MNAVSYHSTYITLSCVSFRTGCTAAAEFHGLDYGYTILLQPSLSFDRVLGQCLPSNRVDCNISLNAQG